MSSVCYDPQFQVSTGHLRLYLHGTLRNAAQKHALMSLPH